MDSAAPVLPCAPRARSVEPATVGHWPLHLLAPLAALESGSKPGRLGQSALLEHSGLLEQSGLLERGLLAPSALVERLFDCARDTLFFVKNRGARYVAVNQALAGRCGAEAKAAVLGRTALELFPDPLGGAYYAQDRHVLDSGAEIRDHLQLTPREGGRWGWSLSYKFPLTDPIGRVIGLCGICKDVDGLATARTPHNDGSAPLERAVAHIQRHYPECVRMEQLAHLAGLTTRQLERLVKRRYHLTPVQLLARTRVEAAMQRLADGGESIAKIASACGYSDQSAFTRQFKAAVGMTPSRYRTLARDRQELAFVS
jgi:AraC-like DNA-binding protein/PAS domain-containing protein